MRFLLVILLTLFMASCSESDEEKAMSFSLSGSNVTGSFSHASLRDVASVIANQAHIVIRIPASLDGEVNASFNNVPMKQALDIIFKPYDVDLTYADKAARQVREVVLLAEGEDANVAEVFAPQRGAGSLLSQSIQKNRQNSVLTAQGTASIVQGNPVAQRKVLLEQELNALQQQKRVFLQQKRDVSALSARIDTMQREMNVADRGLRNTNQSAIYNRQEIEQQRRKFL